MKPLLQNLQQESFPSHEVCCENVFLELLIFCCLAIPLDSGAGKAADDNIWVAVSRGHQ